MPNYLVTYRPICSSPAGLSAVELHRIPKYVDASCRREPDFEIETPSITALCRGPLFAPCLRIGDRVAYITKMGRYERVKERHHRLTALLEVTRRFDSHDAAATWYRAQKGFEKLPSNCMVPGNDPLPLDRTGGISRASLKRLVKGKSAEEAIRIWDLGYQVRAKENSVFLACKASFLNLMSPPVILKDEWVEWYGDVPGTQNPPELEDRVWEKLLMKGAGKI